MNFNFVGESANREQIAKTLNNVAVEYFKLGLQSVSYQILDGLYHAMLNSLDECKDLMPVISCNLGYMLRQNSNYDEAYMVCKQGIRCCFDTNEISAMPELILQIAILSMYLGNTQKAKYIFTLGKDAFQWSRHTYMNYSFEEIMQQNFLMYYS